VPTSEGLCWDPGIRSGPHGSPRASARAFPTRTEAARIQPPRGFRERNSSCAPTHRVTHLDVAVDIEMQLRDLQMHVPTASDLSDKYKNSSSAKQVRRSSARRINALARSRDLTRGDHKVPPFRNSENSDKHWQVLGYPLSRFRVGSNKTRSILRVGGDATSCKAEGSPRTERNRVVQRR